MEGRLCRINRRGLLSLDLMLMLRTSLIYPSRSRGLRLVAVAPALKLVPAPLPPATLSGDSRPELGEAVPAEDEAAAPADIHFEGRNPGEEI